MRLGDFIVCIAIQTCVPLLAWIALHSRPVSRGMQATVAFLWTWLVSFLLVLLADKLHDSSVYQPVRPWDYLFYEGGIIVYLELITPIFGLIAGALTFIPFARKLR
jgi:hypothetical protein